VTVLERALNRGPMALTVAAISAIQSSIYRRIGIHHIERRINNYRMLLDLDDPGISRALNLFRERELDQKYMLRLFLGRGMRVFDIGSNIGYYPLLELELMEGMGHLVCIEPVPSNATLLRYNLQLNGYKNVEVLEAAVSNECAVKDFAVAQKSNLGSFHPVDYITWKEERANIKTIDMPKLCRRYGKPDLIRMDVEGHEVEILNSLLEADAKPVIVFETHHDRYNADHDMEAPLKELFKRFYRCAMVSSAQEDRTAKIEAFGYKPWADMKTDAVIRTIFGPIEDQHALNLICSENGGARTVVLQPWR